MGSFMTRDEKFVELIEKTDAIVQNYGYVNIDDWAWKRWENKEITEEERMGYRRLYERYVHRRAYLSRVTDEQMEQAETLYQTIPEWEVEEKVRQEEACQEEARQEEELYKGEIFVKEGDYVLMCSGVIYGRWATYRSRYEVFEVVEDLKLKPLFDYRYRKWGAAPISDWFPEGADNIAVILIQGGLPKEYLSERHSYIWSSDDHGIMKYIDGKWEINLACETHHWKTGRRDFRQELCEGRRAILACFDPKKPLPIEKQRDYIVKHYGGEYYVNVPWKKEYWKSMSSIRTIK